MANNLTPTLYTAEGVELFSQAARRLGQRKSVHVKLDTGMHRVGALPADVPAILQAVADDPLLVFEGLWTHLAVADGESADDRDFTLGQLASFDAVLTDLASRRCPPQPGARRQHGGRHRLSHGALRHGALRDRSLRLPPRPGGERGAAAPAPRAPRSDRHFPCGRGSSPCARWRKVRAPPTAGCARCPGAPWWPRFPWAMPTACRGPCSTEGYSVLIGGRRRPLAGMVTMDQIVVDCGDDTLGTPG